MLSTRGQHRHDANIVLSASTDELGKMCSTRCFVGGPSFVGNKHSGLVQIEADGEVEIMVNNVRIVLQPEASMAGTVGGSVIESAHRRQIANRPRRLKSSRNDKEYRKLEQ